MKYHMLLLCFQHTYIHTYMLQLHRDAWTWFWKMVSDQMANALEVRESGEINVIRSSWEEAKTSRPAEELGEVCVCMYVYMYTYS